MQKTIHANLKVLKISPSCQIEQNKTFSMIPHSLHNKEYFWSYGEEHHFIFLLPLFFSSFNCKYLKLMKMDIVSVFAFKPFNCGNVVDNAPFTVYSKFNYFVTSFWFLCFHGCSSCLLVISWFQRKQLSLSVYSHRKSVQEYEIYGNSPLLAAVLIIRHPLGFVNCV